MDNELKSIKISQGTKTKLDDIKIIRRESYEDVIIRLIKNMGEK